MAETVFWSEFAEIRIWSDSGTLNLSSMVVPVRQLSQEFWIRSCADLITQALVMMLLANKFIVKVSPYHIPLSSTLGLCFAGPKFLNQFWEDTHEVQAIYYTD